MRCGSLFDPVVLGEAEFLEILETFELPKDGAVRENALGPRIERIVSEGHVSPEGFWYDQDEPEWVALLQGTAELEFEDGRRHPMEAGDWLAIPAHERHRVAYTSSAPPCVWLAVFGAGSPETAGVDLEEKEGTS